MTDTRIPPIGSIMWADLTVEDAPRLRAFYKEVVGWTATDVDMGGYHDYCMNQPEDARTVATLPPQWLIYVTVQDLDASVDRCVALGGEVIAPPRDYGGTGRYAVLRDPAGAPFAVFEAAPPAA